MKLVKFKTQQPSNGVLPGKIGSKNSEGERILTWALLFAVLCHNLACLWFLVGELAEDGWVMRYNYTHSDKGEQYVAAIYFIVTTITTVGYGDITGGGGSAAEQAFGIFLMLIGVVSYSVALSSFMSAISALN